VLQLRNFPHVEIKLCDIFDYWRNKPFRTYPRGFIYQSVFF
jgi:hypothetical protein